MRLTRATRALASWIACIGVLMAALAPAVSHALHLATKSEAMSTCPEMGMPMDTRHASGGQSRDSNPALPASRTFEHCPYCTLHASGTGPLPTVPSAVALLELSFETPQPLRTSFVAAVPWTAPQSRAPPFSA